MYAIPNSHYFSPLQTSPTPNNGVIHDPRDTQCHLKILQIVFCEDKKPQTVSAQWCNHNELAQLIKIWGGGGGGGGGGIAPHCLDRSYIAGIVFHLTIIYCS